MEGLRSIIEKAGGIGDDHKKALGEILNERVPEALRFIESSTANMDRLIKAILELSRMGRRRLKTETLDSRKVAMRSMEALAHLIEKNQIVATVGDLPAVRADVLALEQIFGNLLDNAVKYMSPDRPGEIEVLAGREDGMTVFHVKDNGAGIAKGDTPLVFDLFKRVGENDTGGEGMGLTYVQTLVRRHGGRVWCESGLGKGTTISFTIPDRPERYDDQDKEEGDD